MSDWRNRVVTNPDILAGKPTIRGTRISVELILGWLGSGWTIEEILREYPQIAREDVHAALNFAAACVRNGRLLTTSPEETQDEHTGNV